MKRAKRLLSLLLCMLMLVSNLPVQSFAAGSNTNLTCTVSAEEVNVGETFTVKIGNKAMSISSLFFGLSFDNELLEVTNITSNPTIQYDYYDEENEEDVTMRVPATAKSTVDEANNTGNVGLAYMLTQEQEYSKKTTIVTVTFKAIASGEAIFTVYEDSDGTDGYYNDTALTAIVNINGTAASTYNLYINGTVSGDPLEAGTDLTAMLNGAQGTKDGYNFTGWKFYSDASNTNEVTLTTPYKMTEGDLYAVAQWEKLLVSKELYIDGANKGNVEEGTDLNTVLTSLTGKTVADYNFYNKAGEKVTLSDGKMPAYELYAKTLYTVTFVNPDGGEALATWREEAGASLSGKTLPSMTNTADKKFAGWFVDGETSIPDTMPAKNLEILAVFDDVFKVTYMNGEDEYGEANADTSDKFTIAIDDPDEKTGYTFKGWKDEAGNLYKKGDILTLTKDTTLTAYYEINKYTVTWVVDGEVYETEDVEHGKDATPVTVPAKAGHDGEWDKACTNITEDTTITAVYEAGTYTITLNAGDHGSFGGEATKAYEQVYNTDLVMEAPTAAEGYEFDYWTLNGEKVNNLPTTMPGDNRTYVANWKLKSVSIAFNANGGEAAQESASGLYFQNVTAPEATREGYDFLGWAASAAADAEVLFAKDDNIQLTDAAPATLYAKWQVKSYKVIYMVDGVKVHEDTFNYDAPVTAWTYTPADGYNFSGWGNQVPATMPAKNVTVNGTTTIKTYTITWNDDEGNLIDTTTVNHGDLPTHADPTKAQNDQFTYTFAGWTPEIVVATCDTAYKAQFTPVLRSYDITFVVDGQENKVVPTQYGYIPAYNTDSSVVPTKASDTKYSYTFAGWKNSEDDVLESLPAVTGEATYTATWTETPVEYTVTVKLDDETVYTVTAGYNTPITYPETVTNPTKTGHSFNGWDTELPANIPVGGAEINGTFKINQYTITFMNGDTKVDEIVANYNAPITAPAPTKEGHELTGWKDAEGNAFTYTTMPADNMTVYAQWQVKSYDVVWVIGGQTYQTTPVEYGAEITAPTLPTKNGYTFSGWSTIPATMPAETVTITGSWNPNEYTITFDTDDGEPAVIDPITAPFGSDITEKLPKDPTKTGYTFAGWVDEYGESVNLDTMPLEGANVKAKWTVNEFVINFFATEGDTTAHASFDVPFGTDLRNNIGDDPATEEVEGPGYSYLDWMLGQIYDMCGDPTKEGHTWQDWNYSSIPTTMPAEAVNIYGTWTVNSYDVNYYVDGEWVHTESVAYGEAIPDYTYTPEAGYSFSGWGNQVPATMPARDVEITGTTTPISYTITFNTNGGEPNVIDSITEEYKASITKPDDPTMTGHKFLGWSTDGTKEAIIEFPETMPAENLTLYAVWQRDTFCIEWDTNGDGVVDSSKMYEYGDEITAPDAVKAADTKWTYRHVGWKDAENVDVTFPATATHAATYTAVFEENQKIQYPVKFVAADDANTVYFETTLPWGTEFNLTDLEFVAPTEEGKTLSWYVGNTKAEFPYTMPTEQVIFVANWTSNTYTITVDGVEKTFTYGENVSIADPAAQEGKTFSGWTVTKTEDGTEIDPPAKMPAYDITYTSNWTDNTYELKFEYWAGEADWQTVVYEDVAYGTELEALIPTVASFIDSEGVLYEFQSWSGEIPATMPANNLSVYATFTFTGWKTEEGGTTYYTKSEKTYYDWAQIVKDGPLYWFDGASYIVKDITLIDDSYYAFDHDTGVFLSDLTGIYTANNGDRYYVENGIAVKNYGLHQEVDGEGHIHYYIFGCGLANCQEEGGCQGEYKAQKNNFHLVSKTNGYPLPVGAYDTLDNCVLKHAEDTSLNGISVVDGVKMYLIDGVPVHKGLFEINGDFYYARTRGFLIVGQNYWVSANKLNGLTYNGEPITAGVYEFDADGKMVFVAEKNGFHFDEAENAWYYYVDNKPSYEGLRYFDGTDGANGTNGGALGCTEGRPGYYYINTYGMVIAGRDYWITKTNDTGIKNMTYTFDAYGTMQNPVKIRNGIYVQDGKLCYYKDSKLNYAGLMVYTGDVYSDDGSVVVGVYKNDYLYVNSKGEVKTNCNYWISKTNGLMPAMSYDFDEYGRMIEPADSKDENGQLKNGIVAENGTLYYYVDGVRTYAGVIEIDGNYYYVRTSGELAHSTTYWPTKHNGLVKLQTYTFDENGVMQNPVVIG